jgi:hypothetical protein
MRPCARGPGASAMGGAGVGDGDRELGSVAAGMVEYECWAMRDGKKFVVAIAVLVSKQHTHRMLRCVYSESR